MRGDIIPPQRPKGRIFARPRMSSVRKVASPAVHGETKNAVAPAPSVPTPSGPAADTAATPARKDRLRDIDPLTMDPPVIDEEPKKKWTKKNIMLAAVTALLAVIVLGFLALVVWYAQQLRAVTPGSGEMVKVAIEPGTGTAGIAKLLKDNDLIRNESAFEWYVRIEGKAARLQSGSYRLSKSEDLPTIVGHLTSGKTDTFSITFLPGATLTQHRKVLLDAGFDAAQVDAALTKTYDHPIFEGKPAGTDLEGYIYGETYDFPATATPEEILVHAFDQFELVVKQNDLVNAYKAQGFSLYQGITMASIIQREVATPEDAAQVAQVFKKRYDAGMQLGSDVTYQYIADKTGQERNVNIDSPYNTRRYAGLPPGPISSPGLAALKGVAHPAPGDYLYFLSGDDDKTYFAHTNEEHERNIREHCQKKCQII